MAYTLDRRELVMQHNVGRTDRILRTALAVAAVVAALDH
jgi:hypothetical protein